MALEGPLKELHLQDVFQLLELGRKSGVLRVSSELHQARATVCFDRGGVVAAALGDDPQPIGVLLLKAGRITEDDLSRALARQAAGDRRRLGDVLVAAGAISRRELDRQLKGKLEDAIYQLLAWTEGYFRFEEGAPCAAAVDSPVRIPTEALLMEAARRIDEWSRIAPTVPHLGVIPRLPPPEQQGTSRLDLQPFEWEVLAAADGERDLHALAEALERSEFEVARTVCALTRAGLLVLDDPTRGEAPPTPTVEALLGMAQGALARADHLAAAQVLSEILVLEPLLPEAHRLLGVCHAARGRLREAAAAWAIWEQLGQRTGEDGLAPSAERLREAAEMLAKELERYRD